MITLPMPQRPEKPRNTGLTHVLDKSLGCNGVKDLIETSKDYIDILKLGWGTAYVTHNLKEKLELYRNAGINVCFGGTFFECCYAHNKVDQYDALLQEYGLEYVEISNGSVDIPLNDKLKIIEKFSKKYKVMSEVGSKDINVVVAPYKWVEEIKTTLQAGAWKVVTEGRESGTAGVFRETGEIRQGLIEEIIRDIKVENLIFEAPKKNQQVWFIKSFGANVNLGNIACDEVISVETLRLGLRGDTILAFHGGKQ